MEVFLSVLSLIAGLGVLMIGMKMLSDGLERSAGKGMRKMFGKISNNRFAGIGVGAVATVLVNSSAATTVMVIGFVNAGLMTLFQATSIIMGANIGTTLTGVIIALSGFDIGAYMAILAFIGVAMMMFSKHDTVKKVGSAIAGLGLMFVGLSFMSSALKDSEVLSGALQDLFAAVDFPLLLIFIGLVCTALFQSSTAMTALVVTMAAPALNGVPIIPMESALFIILGTNIGTCITAIIASFGASTNAKRTATIHLLFNAIGTIVFTTVIWIFKDGVVWLFAQMTSSTQMQVALFHVFFNIITTLMLVPFIKPLTKLATVLVKEKR
ncbi:MAG: Na/Pi symporter, partial [Clostridiales bacterium]|nr:Na/Pi symporter [Clostridiales bacterium]